MEDCVFCKMFAGEVETRKVYENGDVIGVLDVAPRFAQGQCVVTHRRHVPQFYDLEDEELAQLFVGVKAVARKIREAFGTPLVSIFSRGITVPTHNHVIVFPATGEGPMDRVLVAFLAAEVVRQTTPAQLDEIAEKIRTV
jgi:diadenosine tetraphosphate (Ap4A) HIT family hydrolase